MREKGDSDDGGTREGIVHQRNGPRWSRMPALIKVDLPSRRALPSKSIPHPWLAGRRYVAACQNCIRYSLVLQPQVYRQQWRHRMGDSKDRGQGDHHMQEEWRASRRDTSLRDVWLEAKMIGVVNVVQSHARVCAYTSHHKLSLHSLLARVRTFQNGSKSESHWNLWIAHQKWKSTNQKMHTSIPHWLPS